MPEPSGDVTFTRIRRLDPDLPVVVMSGYAEPEVRARCGGDADYVLQKPFGLEELSELMSRALRAGSPPGTDGRVEGSEAR
jgi:two-component system cell cycle sensor histidine kinase/response regulator CckA